MVWFAKVLFLVPIVCNAGDSADREFFEKSIRPLFAEHCWSCHGPERQRAGLRLDSHAALLAGGENGPVMVPGSTAESRLLRAVSYEDIDLQMPPRGRLSDSEIEALRRWVEAGAYWPEEDTSAPAHAEPPFDLAARRAAHWCWQPIERPLVPELPNASRLAPIDAFLRERQAASGIDPAPRADPAVLLRRLSFALTGLPPSPADVASLDQAAGTEWFERQVDEFLHSPHYADHWARHWLDLVRYAETYGHEFDYPIEHAHEYRDYVLRALDADVPYDQLLVEHVAGDLLETPRRNPDNGINESILGTGFWFFHQATHSPVDVRMDEAERVDNQIDVFSKTFLGLTVSCARCHDHKFDAISTADYYALSGYLQSSRQQYTLLDRSGEIAAGRSQLREWSAQGSAIAAEPAAIDEVALARAFVGAQALLDEFGPDVQHFEAQDLEVLAKSAGEWREQGLDGRWTKGQQMWWTDAKPGDALELGIEVARDSEYELSLSFTKARDYARVQLLWDGVAIPEVVDLFDTGVVPSGPVAVWRGPLAAGRHSLALHIAGHHPDAVPAFMVGLDTVTLQHVAATREQARDRAWALVLAQIGGDSALLDTALAALDARSDVDHADPLWIWRRGLELAASAHTLPDFVAAMSGAVRAVEQPPAASSALFTFDHFPTPEGDLESWTISGEAFADRPSAGGEWQLAFGADAPRFSERGTLSSAQFGRKLQGSIASPTFELTSPFLHYRIAGEGCQVRVIIDGYTLDVFNSLIFTGVSFDVNTGGDWTWIAQGSDLSRYVGHRVHIEVHDKGDGWVMLDEVRAGDSTPNFTHDMRYARAVLTALDGMEQDAGLASERGGPAAGGPTTLRDALARAMAAALVAEQRPWLLKHGFLPAPLERLRDLAGRARALDASLPAPARALAMADGSAEDEAVFVRGNPKNRGPVVPRRSLEALGGSGPTEPKRGSGRLEFARSLLAEDNPLVARVAVNRVWHHLFGRGLVESVDNFGVLGREPSHPELLDWLADWFRRDAKWSLRALIRQIVLTEAWQQSSEIADPVAERVDPRNVLLHRQNLRRLQAESIRDAVLCVSGRLDPTRFGQPVPVHLTPFLDGRGRPGSSGPLDGGGRRSIYQEVRRNFLSPMLLAFDFPLPASTVGARTVSNVPAQGLVLLNDPFVHEQAALLAARVAGEFPDVDQQLRELLVRMFGRAPRPGESEQLRAFLDAEAAVQPDAVLRLQALVHVLLNTKEFVFVR